MAGPSNAAVLAYDFLSGMRGDDYFPDHLFERGRQILLDLCAAIEAQRPSGEAVYALTHEATERFNELALAFEEADSEIETFARDEIATDVEFILATYGHGELDLEEALAPRDW